MITPVAQPVRTVWGFVKGGKVYPPKNSQHPRPKSVCDLLDAWRLSGYTTIIPTTTSLLQPSLNNHMTYTIDRARSR